MKYIVTTEFFNFDNRGNAKIVPAGTILTQKQFRGLNEIKKAKCELVEATRSNYTDEEAQFLFDSYLEFDGDEKATLMAFFNEFGFVHPVGSVQSKIRRISVLDPSKENDTEWQSDKQIESVASMAWN